MTRMRGTLFWKGKRPPEGKLTIVDQVELVSVCVCKRVRETKQSEVKEEREEVERETFFIFTSPKKRCNSFSALDAVQPHCVQYSHRIENQNNERIFCTLRLLLLLSTPTQRNLLNDFSVSSRRQRQPLPISSNRLHPSSRLPRPKHQRQRRKGRRNR